MNRTATRIDAIVNKAKQQRTDYIGAKLQDTVLPVVLATVLSLCLVELAGGAPSQAQETPVEQTTAQQG